MAYRLFALGICAITAVIGATAQPERNSTGFLLSLRGPSGYRTMWLTTSGGRLTVSRVLKKTIVPHGPKLCEIVLQRISTTYLQNTFPREPYAHAGIGVRC